MNAERLLYLYDRISEAPGVVARLRRFVLDLAVRGKLVEQDPKDEPAGELLSRIIEERFAVNRKAVIVNRDPKEGGRFRLPESWRWTAIETVSHVEMGQSPSSDHYNQQRYGIPFFQGKTDFGVRNPTPRYWCSKPTKIATPGDVLISVRAPVGPTNVADTQCCIGRGLASIRPASGVELEFLLLALKASEPDLAAMGFGSTFTAINKKQLTGFEFPLPPLAEQQRIAAKVDELMSLCDRLEEARTHREALRDRLTAASLARLSAPDIDVDTFKSHARFALDALPALTTRPNQVKALRQTILNLAVRGKLVKQDPADEPASELLKRIASDMLEGARDGSRKKAKPLQRVNLTDAPFDLPNGWDWARFPEVGVFGRGKSKHRPRNDPILYEDGKWPFIQTGDVARSGGSIETYSSSYSDVGLAQSAMWPAGTLCITIAANIADSGILRFDACFPDSVVGLVPHECFGGARYFEYFMRTAKADLHEFAPSTAQKNINLSILTEVLIPLPPLSEQHRIVAKVYELMALCDRLEASLTTAEGTRGNLLCALLDAALAVDAVVGTAREEIMASAV